METRRLYQFGELIDDLREHTLDLWFKDVGRGATWRATTERKLESVELSIEYSLTGTAWFTFTIAGKRAAWTRDYPYKAWVRPGDTFELDERCIT